MRVSQLVRSGLGALLLVSLPFAACEAQTDSARTLESVVSTFILEQRFEKTANAPLKLKAQAVAGIAVAINEPLDLRIARAYYIQSNGFSTLTKEYVELTNAAEAREMKASLALTDYLPGWLKLRSENLAYQIKIELFRDVEDPGLDGSLAAGKAEWAVEVARIADLLRASQTPELMELRKQLAAKIQGVLAGHPEYGQPFSQARAIVEKAGRSGARVKAVASAKARAKKE